MNTDPKAITVEIPAVRDYSRILRLTAAGAADACGFDIDLIEDVKVIVSEVFSSAIESQCKEVKFIFLPGDGCLEINICTCSSKHVLEGANELTLPILQALAGTVEEDSEGGLRLVMEK